MLLKRIGILGTITTALCCFTPVLVVLFGAVGLSWLVGYLDYVLFPALAIFAKPIVESRPKSVYHMVHG